MLGLKGKSAKVFSAAVVGAGLYGAGLGLAAKPEQPKSLDEARQTGSWANLGFEIPRDIALGLADDALAFAAYPFIPKKFKALGNAAIVGVGVLGTGVAGGIAGRDVSNFAAARRYMASNSTELQYSQNVIPDKRLNTINGFQSGGAGAAQRTEMTGIASPAAGGIMYRMTKFNNEIWNKNLRWRNPTISRWQSTPGVIETSPRTSGTFFSWGRKDDRYTNREALGGNHQVFAFATPQNPAFNSSSIYPKKHSKLDANINKYIFNNGSDSRARKNANRYLTAAGIPQEERTSFFNQMDSMYSNLRGFQLSYPVRDRIQAHFARKAGFDSIARPGSEYFALTPSAYSTHVAGLANERLRGSQAMIPDRRLGKIDGFQSGGPGAAQRTAMTGIASPAAGGIFYRMQHNPFADIINTGIGIKDPEQEDPRTRALTLSYFGGLLGTAVGARGGLAKASIYGIIGGIAGGAYGIYHAQSPDMGKNMQAIGDIALGAAPVLTAAGLLFGARKIPGIGPHVDRFLDFSTKKFGQGSHLSHVAVAKLIEMREPVSNKISHTIGMMKSNMGRSSLWAQIDARTDVYHQMTKDNLFVVPHIPANKMRDDFVNNGFEEAAAKTITGPMTAAQNILEHVVTPTLFESGKFGQGRWNQSIAVGHILTILPHQAAVAYAGLELTQSNRRSKATNTMPSNRRSN